MARYLAVGAEGFSSTKTTETNTSEIEKLQELAYSLRLLINTT
jgi:hypothetical protein